jgi:diadenosine tetraphosphate (Ap4A) HIT family hydrolase
MFELDYRLESDCVWLGSLSLCRILLMKDANYPWVLLVPKRVGINEIYQLDIDDQEQLVWESSFVSERLMQAFDGTKMNIAALGNIVSQLHIHHVVRTENDPSWPNPVWGTIPPKAYTPQALSERIKKIQQALNTSTFVPN